MGKAGNTGVTTSTPSKILFGAGTIHKNLVYTPGSSGAAGSWNFEDSIVGATSGGSKFEYKPEFKDVEADGANVLVKGMKEKIGESAKMDINFAEITKELIKSSIIGKDGTSEDSNYDLIESKAAIAEGDYWDNIAFVGKTLKGKNIIVILGNALCTSGLAFDAKPKENSVPAVTFESHAGLDTDLQTLPVKIYYPKTTV